MNIKEIIRDWEDGKTNGEILTRHQISCLELFYILSIGYERKMPIEMIETGLLDIQPWMTALDISECKVDETAIKEILALLNGL